MGRPTIAFIAHPLSLSSLGVISGWPQSILNFFGSRNVRQFLEWKKPFVFNRIPRLVSKTGDEIDLIGVACPLMPDQLVSLPYEIVLKRIRESVELAENNGASLAVLGGFTSVIGNEGQDVSKMVNIAVTSGNTLTAGLTISGIEIAAQKIGLSKIRKCVVIGATGDIGSACANYFATRVEFLACVARDQIKLEQMAERMNGAGYARIACYGKIREAVKDADVIISATSALTTIIEAADLAPGVIVSDVALPANIAREVARKRKDILVYEGGLSRPPFASRVTDQKWINLMPHEAIYGCLAEGLVLGFEKKFENFSIGRGNITDKKIKLIMNLSAKHGFETADFFSGDKFYNHGDLKLINNVLADRSIERV